MCAMAKLDCKLKICTILCSSLLPFGWMLTWKSPGFELSRIKTQRFLRFLRPQTIFKVKKSLRLKIKSRQNHRIFFKKSHKY